MNATNMHTAKPMSNYLAHEDAMIKHVSTTWAVEPGLHAAGFTIITDSNVRAALRDTRRHPSASNPSATAGASKFRSS